MKNPLFTRFFAIGFLAVSLGVAAGCTAIGNLSGDVNARLTNAATITSQELVGEVGTDALIGFTVQGGTLKAYVCGKKDADWERFTSWFSGEAKDGKFSLSSDKGLKLEGTLTDGKASGTLTLADGTVLNWQAETANAQIGAGLFRREEGDNLTGLIVDNRLQIAGGRNRRGQGSTTPPERVKLQAGQQPDQSRCLPVMVGQDTFNLAPLLQGNACGTKDTAAATGSESTSLTQDSPRPQPSPLASDSPTPQSSDSATPAPQPSPALESSSPQTATEDKGKLYVANANGNSITRYDGVLNPAVKGNVAPAAVIKGANTTFNEPVFLFLDSPNDRLYIPNRKGNSILVYNRISTRNGNVAPDRIISGASTTFDAPTYVTLDKQRDLMYVANMNKHAVLIFENASSINGDVAPARTIAGDNTTFKIPHGLLVDSSSDKLYVANTGNFSIDVFNNASTASGNIAPSLTLAGGSTRMNLPLDMLFDLQGNMVVVNRDAEGSGFTNATSPSNSVTVYANGKTVSGDVSPTRQLSNATSPFDRPHQIFLNQGTDALYIANPFRNQVLIYSNFSTLNGDLAPNRTIAGPATQMLGPTGAVLDSTR